MPARRPQTLALISAHSQPAAGQRECHVDRGPAPPSSSYRPRVLQWLGAARAARHGTPPHATPRDPAVTLANRHGRPNDGSGRSIARGREGKADGLSTRRRTPKLHAPSLLARSILLLAEPSPGWQVHTVLAIYSPRQAMDERVGSNNRQANPYVFRIHACLEAVCPTENPTDTTAPWAGSVGCAVPG